MRLCHLTAAFTAFLAIVSSVIAQVGNVAPGAVVRGVEPTPAADLVILSGGFNSGLRQGMICRVVRHGAEVAELLVVEVRQAHSASLLLNVVSGQSVRAGDIVRVKTLKS